MAKGNNLWRRNGFITFALRAHINLARLSARFPLAVSASSFQTNAPSGKAPRIRERSEHDEVDVKRKKSDSKSVSFT